MNRYLYALLFVALVGVDQFSKYWVVLHQASYDNNLFFGIFLSYNRGISWGMFHSENTLAFVLLSLFIAATLSLFMWYTYHVYRAHESILANVFVCAGAVSNFIDRLHYGAVVDFILFYWRDWHFPIFNIADAFIFCGIVYILLFQYRESWHVSVKK